MSRIAILCQSKGRGGRWQARRLPYLLRRLVADGHQLAVLGPEPQEVLDHERILNHTGLLSKHEIMREVAECDLAVCVDEQCYPALAAEVPLVGLFFEYSHLDLIPVDYAACTALYPSLGGDPGTISPTYVADRVTELIAGDSPGVRVYRAPAPPRYVRNCMWSVIVFCHDSTPEQTEATRRCIESIRANTTVSHEIVVVDRCSRPETVDMIRTQQDLHGVFLRDSGGTAGAVRAGLQSAHGDLLVLLHNDQTVGPGWEEGFIEAFEQGALMAGTRAWRLAADGVVASTAMEARSFLGFSGTAVPRSLLSSLGAAGPVADYLELADTCWRVQATGLDVCLIKMGAIDHFGGLTRPRSVMATGACDTQDDEADVPPALRHASDLLARWPQHAPESLTGLRERLTAEARRRAIDRAHAAYFPEQTWAMEREGTTPAVSVVMATYNQAEYLRAAVDSILGQSYSNIQAIVVDDGSTDETAQVLAEYEDPRLEVVHLGANQGICAAYNAGFERVRGAYCSWTSSDNVTHPDQIARLLDVLRGDEERDLVYSDFEFFGSRRGPAGWGEVSFEDVYSRGATIGPSFLFRSELLRRTGSPPADSRVSGVQDTLMWLDFLLQTEFAYIPEVLYSYRTHRKQLTAEILRSSGYDPLLSRMREVFDGKYRSWPGQLRVLHVYCYCCHGGVEAVLRNLIPALAERDIASEACFVQDLGARRSFESLCPTHVIGSTERFMVVPRLREIIRNGQFHVIHELSTPEVYEAAVEAGFEGPIISGCHGNLELWAESMAWEPDALVTVSQHVVDEAVSHGIDRADEATVIANPVPVERFRTSVAPRGLAAAPNRRVVIWVGRVAKKKNWELFLDVARRLREQREDLEFWLVGEASIAAEEVVRQAVRERGLSSDLRYMRAVPYEDMPGVYAAVRDSGGVLVVTSDTESFGMVVAEAMAAGVPVVSRKIGGVTEVVEQGKSAFLVDGTDPVRYAAFVSLLLDSGEQYEALADAGHTRAKVRFDCGLIGDAYADLIRKQVMATAVPGAVILSGSRWGTSGGGQRPRKLAEALRQSGYRVLFVEQFEDAAFHAPAPGGVDVISAGELLVGADRYRREYDARSSAVLTDALRRRLGIVEPVVAVNCDYSRLSLEHMRSLRMLGARVVYDVMDDWEGLCEGEGGSDGNAGYTLDVEREIINSADIVTSSASTLAQHLKEKFELHSLPAVIPNSLDPDFLLRPVDGRPEELPSCGPIIGYVGSVWGNWQDWEALLEVARSRPEWQVVIVGGLPEQCAYRGPAAAEFVRQSNVHFIDEVPQKEIHRYIDAFDVAVIPFKAGGITRFVHPLKIYDYLARRRPVVSCYLPEIDGFPHVRFADGPPQWPEAIEHALAEQVDAGAVLSFLQERTWAKAVEKLLSAAGVSGRAGGGADGATACHRH